MSSEIEVVDEVQSRDHEPSQTASASTANGDGDENLRNDVYTAAAYGDLEKLQRLVECEGCSVSEPDGLGYYALQWAALNNRTAAARYIIEVRLSNLRVFVCGSFGKFDFLPTCIQPMEFLFSFNRFAFWFICHWILNNCILVNYPMGFV